MNRRTYLASVGSLTALALAGCLSDQPEARNEFGYETLEQNGVDVPLAPLRDVVDWFDDDAAVFIDTRTQQEYNDVRIHGAELSPAPDGLESNDPVASLAQDTRIVTYCVCPHTLATLRGASVIRAGYENLYALDEGLQAWVDGGYPIEGTRADEFADITDIHIEDYEDRIPNTQ